MSEQQPLDPNSPVAIARLMALKQAVRLEATGMKHSSGKKMRVVACAALGLKRTTKADDVIGALAREIDKRLKAQQKPACPNCGLSEFMEATLPRDHHTHHCTNCNVHSSPLGPKENSNGQA